jgi:hypothetical protein
VIVWISTALEPGERYWFADNSFDFPTAECGFLRFHPVSRARTLPSDDVSRVREAATVQRKTTAADAFCQPRTQAL